MQFVIMTKHTVHIVIFYLMKHLNVSQILYDILFFVILILQVHPAEYLMHPLLPFHLLMPDEYFSG